jgi:5,10-methenyltetrahydrofolate synthetase
LSTLKKQKQQLRNKIKQQRQVLDIYTYIALNKQVFNNFVSFFNSVVNNKIFLEGFGLFDIKDLKIALYYPINFECNTLEIIKFLNEKHCLTMLPKVIENLQNLSFNDVNYSDIINFKNLYFNKYGTLEVKNFMEVENIPHIIIAPLLGFDEHGNRLGYGGGYYDQTLFNINKTKKALYVGLAFESEASDNNINQKCESVPVNSMDYKLDFVVTNKNIYIIDKK